jgi:hypothetical protein
MPRNWVRLPYEYWSKASLIKYVTEPEGHYVGGGSGGGVTTTAMNISVLNMSRYGN